MRGTGLRGTGLRIKGLQRVGADRDLGAATVWVLAAGLLTVLVALASSAAGAAMVARHRAQAAADLGALAGAGRAMEGEDAACLRARGIVAANSARLVACRLDGFDLTVTTEVSPAGVAGLAGTARASARAGPAS